MTSCTTAPDAPNTGLLTNTECIARKCHVPPPSNGALGNCPPYLPSDSKCYPVCNEGYTLSHSIAICHLGQLTASITCSPKRCERVLAPANGTMGDCVPTLESGQTCSPRCDDGFSVVGATSCTLGTLTAATCELPCDASVAPQNGGPGDCTSQLKPGSNCQPTCNAGFALSGKTSCRAGKLTAATCSCPHGSLIDGECVCDAEYYGSPMCTACPAGKYSAGASPKPELVISCFVVQTKSSTWLFVSVQLYLSLRHA